MQIKLVHLEEYQFRIFYQMAISGYLVIMPDYYRKTWCDPSDEKIGSFIKEKTDWKNLKEEWEQKIQPFAQEKGAQYYGSVGTNNISCDFFCIIF